MFASKQEMKLTFCKKCNNFLYEIVERDKKAFMKCRSCPYEEEITKENPVVYENDIQRDTSIQYSVNKYLKYAPELPRFKNMICNNAECPTRGKESDIVGIKLDPVNVKWFYQCAVCDETWSQLARGP